MEFKLEGCTMSEILERMTEIADGFYGEGRWTYGMETFVPAGATVSENMSHTHPRFRTKVRVWDTTEYR